MWSTNQGLGAPRPRADGWPVASRRHSTLGPYLVPYVIPTIRSLFSKLHLFLREDLTANLLERLRRGELDAWLLALPIHGEDVEVMPLFREPFLVALPKAHALEKKEHINEKELANHSVLLLEEGHCMRDQALAICAPPLRPSATNSRQPASRRCARWWRRVWAAHSCPHWRHCREWERCRTD